MKTLTIELKEIITRDRLRSINEDFIVELMSSIKINGLTSPILINQNNELISGLHRLEASKRLNKTEITCNVIITNSEDEKQLIEIDENLVRDNLHFLDRCNQLVLKKEIYERLNPTSVLGKNKGTSDVKSFAKTVSEQLGKSSQTISRFMSLRKIDSENQKRVKELNLSQKDCEQLIKFDNITEKLDEIEFTENSISKVLNQTKKVEKDLRPQIVTTIKTPICESVNETNTIKRIDLTQQINIEYYYNETRQRGYDIVKNNDFLSYHYFAQDYTVLETSQVICLITITNNNIKEYIGFISLNTPTLNKTYRNKFFGKNFFQNMYKMYKGIKLLNMSRIVMLPSYRGLGITKQLQKQITDDLFSNSLPNFTDVLYVEINSILIHSFDFVDSSFNKTFIKLKEVLSEKEYKDFFTYSGKSTTTQGYKEGATITANTGFRFNEKYINILEEYINIYYNIEIKENEKQDLIKEINNIDFRSVKQPLMLLNINKGNKYELAS